MERIYIYSSLVLMTVAVYHGFSEGYIWLPVILTPIALVVAAKLYAHTQGKQLSQWQKDLPVLKFMACVLRDQRLRQQQNSQSLRVVQNKNDAGLAAKKVAAHIAKQFARQGS